MVHQEYHHHHYHLRHPEAYKSIFLLQIFLLHVEYHVLNVMHDHVNHIGEEDVDIDFHLLLDLLLVLIYLNDVVDYEEEIEHRVDDVHHL